jgi:hypothetical protein
MTDRELLELAARAAGYWSAVFNCPARLPRPGWNPLDDDGDALRLAVKLDLTVRHYSGSAVAQSGAPGTPCAYEEVSNHADPYAAARRAIVQAAAVIGRAISQAPGAAQETQP